MKNCSACGLTILEDSDRRIMWLAWAYSHAPLVDTLCICSGVSPRRSTQTEFPDYPLAERIRDLKSQARVRKRTKIKKVMRRNAPIDCVLASLQERHPSRRITAREWVDANGVDVAEYVNGELLCEVPRQFRFIVQKMAERAVARREKEKEKRNAEREAEKQLEKKLDAYLRTNLRYVN
jgi:hypothetical protein